MGKNTLYDAKQKKHAWLSGGEYSSLIKRVSITRSRKPPQLQPNVVKWLMENTRPTNDLNKKVKWIDPDDNVLKPQPVQWRTEPLSEMFERCKLEITHGEQLKRTYFYNAVPKFIKLVKRKTALCPYHMSADKLAGELVRKRVQWHALNDPALQCVCKCDFCRVDGCDHGKNPDGDGPKHPSGATCAYWKCKRCRDVRCPAEWTKHGPPAVWYTATLTKRLGGGNNWIDKQHTTTRRKMMESWKAEMRGFAEHEKRVEAVKTRVDWLKNNLPRGHILIKGDFIQNITHDRGKETDAAYYNKRQTQLLTFVVWSHTAQSTPEKPDIAISYHDYLSGYLKHTSLFFQKCFTQLMQTLRKDLPHKIKKVILNKEYESRAGRRVGRRENVRKLKPPRFG